MLRNIFVLGCLLVGTYHALLAPFYALLFYMWNAYFRPESWLWNGRWVYNLGLSFKIGVFVLFFSLLSGVKFHMKGRTLLIFLFLVHSYISAKNSFFQTHSMNWWVDFSKALVMTYMITVLVDDLRKFRLTIWIMAMSLGLEGAKQGLVTLVLKPGAVNYNKNPFLGDNNGVAVGMLMLVPLFAALAATAAKRTRFFYITMLIGVLYRALSTYSRGGFLSAIALGGIYWWRSKRKVLMLVMMLVTVGIVVPTLPDAFWERMSTITRAREMEETSALSRLHFWQVGVAMADDNPFFGVGFKASNNAYDKYDFSDGRYGSGRSLHSSWFGVLSELGYPGLIMFALIIFLSIRSLNRIRKTTPRAQRRDEGDQPGFLMMILLSILSGKSVLSKDPKKKPEPEEKGLSDKELFHTYAVAIETALIIYLVGGTFLPFQYNEMFWHCIGLSIALQRIHERPAEDVPPSLAASGAAVAPREGDPVASSPG